MDIDKQKIIIAMWNYRYLIVVIILVFNSYTLLSQSDSYGSDFYLVRLHADLENDAVRMSIVNWMNEDLKNNTKLKFANQGIRRHWNKAKYDESFRRNYYLKTTQNIDFYLVSDVIKENDWFFLKCSLYDANFKKVPNTEFVRLVKNNRTMIRDISGEVIDELIFFKQHGTFKSTILVHDFDFDPSIEHFIVKRFTESLVYKLLNDGTLSAKYCILYNPINIEDKNTLKGQLYDFDKQVEGIGKASFQIYLWDDMEQFTVRRLNKDDIYEQFDYIKNEIQKCIEKLERKNH